MHAARWRLPIARASSPPSRRRLPAAISPASTSLGRPASNGHSRAGSTIEQHTERTMGDEDVVWMGAAELGRRIADGGITSRQATTAYLERIAVLNPSLEVYVTVTADRALAEAAERDVELAKGHRRGPLHGVPYCLKDVIATAGIRTTAGSTILADWVPDNDATVVTRLTAAGAVLLGKVNTHEFAFGVSTQNTHARTRNGSYSQAATSTTAIFAHGTASFPHGSSLSHRSASRAPRHNASTRCTSPTA